MNISRISNFISFGAGSMPYVKTHKLKDGGSLKYSRVSYYGEPDWEQYDIYGKSGTMRQSILFNREKVAKARSNVEEKMHLATPQEIAGLLQVLKANRIKKPELIDLK